MAPVTVDARWIVERRAAGIPPVVCDVRWYLDGRSGRAAYEAGHIPGAVFVDLDRCLAAPPSPAAGRHPLPDPEAFAACLGGRGVGDGDVVVAYDDTGGAVAARLVWMLRVTGREAHLLEGGLGGWRGELEAGSVDRPPAQLSVVPWPEDRLAGIDELVRSSGVVIDVRAAARYRGETEPVDPRAGHVPGAVNVPVPELIDPDSGRLRSPEEVRRRFEVAGVGPGGGGDDGPIVYCGSGVNACFGLLALEHAGLHGGRLYPGSWSQWSSDPDRPVATGEEP